MLSVMETQRRKVGTSFPLESRRCMCVNRIHAQKLINIQLFPVGCDFVNLATPTKQDSTRIRFIYRQTVGENLTGLAYCIK